MRVSGERAVMGERVNSRLLGAAGWATTIIMAIAAVALVVITVLPS